MELAVRDGDSSVYPASSANGERYQWGLDRFIAEARTLAKFKHPAIVRVLSVFEDNNTAYMVMEYELGQSLQQVLDGRKTLGEDDLIPIMAPLLDGLEMIHATGFIHRDVKPANIYIWEDGSPVLLDFGSARQALGGQTKSLTSIVSPGYAPFEQYYSNGDRQGPWTDIYSLAATMYRAISGIMPMDAIDRSEAILKAERDIFVSVGEIGHGRYSPEFMRALDHALSPLPNGVTNLAYRRTTLDQFRAPPAAHWIVKRDSSFSRRGRLMRSLLSSQSRQCQVCETSM